MRGGTKCLSVPLESEIFVSGPADKENGNNKLLLIPINCRRNSRCNLYSSTLLSPDHVLVLTRINFLEAINQSIKNCLKHSKKTYSIFCTTKNPTAKIELPI